MVSILDIYTGAKVRTTEEPVIEGTVQNIVASGVNPYDYYVTIQPDKSMMDNVAESCLYHTLNCFPTDLNLLPCSDHVSHKVVRFKFVTNFFPCNISTDQKSCFYEEILIMVDLYGYTIIESEEDCVCPEAIKENQRIYLHFGELSGYCRPSELECIERMLSCGTTFKIERKIVSEELFDYTFEQELEIYRKRFEGCIFDVMLKAFKTDKSEYVMAYKVIDQMIEKIRIKTLNNDIVKGSEEAVSVFLYEVYDRLCDEGLIETKTENRHLEARRDI